MLRACCTEKVPCWTMTVETRMVVVQIGAMRISDLSSSIWWTVQRRHRLACELALSSSSKIAALSKNLKPYKCSHYFVGMNVLHWFS